MMHYRTPYLRPSFMGGDVFHPLCRVPTCGWAGEAAAALPMTDDEAAVDCPSCLDRLAAGGLSAARREAVRLAMRRGGLHYRKARPPIGMMAAE